MVTLTHLNMHIVHAQCIINRFCLQLNLINNSLVHTKIYLNSQLSGCTILWMLTFTLDVHYRPYEDMKSYTRARSMITCPSANSLIPCVSIIHDLMHLHQHNTWALDECQHNTWALDECQHNTMSTWRMP